MNRRLSRQHEACVNPIVSIRSHAKGIHGNRSGTMTPLNARPGFSADGFIRADNDSPLSGLYGRLCSRAQGLSYCAAAHDRRHHRHSRPGEAGPGQAGEGGKRMRRGRRRRGPMRNALLEFYRHRSYARGGARPLTRTRSRTPKEGIALAQRQGRPPEILGRLRSMLARHYAEMGGEPYQGARAVDVWLAKDHEPKGVPGPSLFQSSTTTSPTS